MIRIFWPYSENRLQFWQRLNIENDAATNNCVRVNGVLAYWISNTALVIFSLQIWEVASPFMTHYVTAIACNEMPSNILSPTASALSDCPPPEKKIKLNWSRVNIACGEISLQQTGTPTKNFIKQNICNDVFSVFPYRWGLFKGISM